VITILLLLPLYWVLSGSFMTPRELFSVHLSLWPHEFVFQNWSDALRRLAPHAATSFVVSLATSALTLLVTGPAAYSVIWLKPRGRKVLQSFMLANLVNTLPGLILADMTLTVPFALVMLCAYVREFPYELVEAALVEGASQWRAFRSVVIPVMTPGLVTIGIFSFLMPWGDLIFSLSLITESGLQPLILELYKAVGQYGVDWSFLLPGSVLTAIPAVVVVLYFSRFIISGFTRGALR
jgi:multiple sugar transport system permease protein